MAKLVMSCAIIFLLATNAMTGYLLYEEVTTRNQLAAARNLQIASNEQPVARNNEQAVTTVKVEGTNKNDSGTAPSQQGIKVDNPNKVENSTKSSQQDIKIDNTNKIDGTKSAQKDTKVETGTATTDSYIYFIDDNKIKEALLEGKQCLLDCDKNFTLPLISSAKNDINYPLEAIIATPYEVVQGYSGLLFYEIDEIPSLNNAKALVSFKSLGFRVPMSRKYSAKDHTVYLEQDNKKIEAIHTDNSVTGTDRSLKQVSFDVKSIDFTKKANLIVENKNNNTSFVYSVDFKKYIQ